MVEGCQRALKVHDNHSVPAGSAGPLADKLQYRPVYDQFPPGSPAQRRRTHQIEQLLPFEWFRSLEDEHAEEICEERLRADRLVLPRKEKQYQEEAKEVDRWAAIAHSLSDELGPLQSHHFQ